MERLSVPIESKKDEPKKKIVSIYLTVQLAEKLKAHVDKTCGNISWWLEKVISEAIEREQKDNGNP